MTPPEHARQRAALSHRLSKELGAAWLRVERTNIRASWMAQIPQLLLLLGAAQRAAAATADAYVGAAVGAGSRSVIPEAFAFTASDGRPLAGLLAQPAITALRAIGSGYSVPMAMNTGRFTAQLIGHTQVADAGRVADLTAAVANPGAKSWTRMLVGKTCARCLILAGRRYTWKADFNRHPRCDCIAVPSQEAPSAAAPVNPAEAFAAMSRAEQVRVFGRDGAEAIRGGADIAQVVNARGGMIRAEGRLYTTVAAGKKRPRLMPEECFREAKGDRAEAVRLLQLHGYIR